MGGDSPGDDDPGENDRRGQPRESLPRKGKGKGKKGKGNGNADEPPGDPGHPSINFADDDSFSFLDGINMYDECCRSCPTFRKIPSRFVRKFATLIGSVTAEIASPSALVR